MSEEIKKLITDFGIEHFDLLEKFGYADPKLDQPVDEQYNKECNKLYEIYDEAIQRLITNARVDENEQHLSKFFAAMKTEKSSKMFHAIRPVFESRIKHLEGEKNNE
jgi:uncharacterized protein YifE (UPF0438 family)